MSAPPPKKNLGSAPEELVLYLYYFKWHGFITIGKPHGVRLDKKLNTDTSQYDA